MIRVKELSIGELNEILKSIEVIQKFYFNQNKMNATYENKNILNNSSILKTEIIEEMTKRLKLDET